MGHHLPPHPTHEGVFQQKSGSSADILYPSSPIDRPGGQQKQGHRVVLHDPGEGVNEMCQVQICNYNHSI